MEVAEVLELTERQRYWLEKLKACEASGKSVAAYASDEGIQVRAMYGAKKVLVKKGVLPRTQQSRFQRVQTQAVNVSSEWRIRYPNGVSVEFSGAADAESLSMILRTVACLE